MAVAMPVMMMVVVVGADRFERWGRGAAMGGLAAADFELDCRVRDVEPVSQRTVDGVEDRGAFGDGHLGDSDMAGKSVARRA